MVSSGPAAGLGRHFHGLVVKAVLRVRAYGLATTASRAEWAQKLLCAVTTRSRVLVTKLPRPDETFTHTLGVETTVAT